MKLFSKNFFNFANITLQSFGWLKIYVEPTTFSWKGEKLSNVKSRKKYFQMKEQKKSRHSNSTQKKFFLTQIRNQSF